MSLTMYGLGPTTLSQSNPPELHRVQNEAMSHSGNNKRHSHGGHALPTGPATHAKQDIRRSKSKRISMRCKIPKIHSTVLSKPPPPPKKKKKDKKRGGGGGGYNGTRQVMDGPSRIVHPACVWPHRAQASRELEKMPC